MKRQIRHAVAQLPASADMLYLEVSWETCNDLQYSMSSPDLVRAVRPSGSAAIVFTTKGRLKITQMLGQQPWHWIDLMYANSIAAGVLEAYISMPPCFMQDGFFGSDCTRHHEMPNVWNSNLRSHVGHPTRAAITRGNAPLQRAAPYEHAMGSDASSTPLHLPVYPVCVEQ